MDKFKQFGYIGLSIIIAFKLNSFDTTVCMQGGNSSSSLPDYLTTYNYSNNLAIPQNFVRIILTIKRVNKIL